MTADIIDLIDAAFDAQDNTQCDEIIEYAEELMDL